MTLRPKKWLIGTMLGSAILAGVSALTTRSNDSGDANGLQVVSHRHNGSQPSGAPTPAGAATEGGLAVRLDQLATRGRDNPGVTEMFGTSPIKPLAALPAPVAKPTPPPFPYAFFGVMRENSQPTIFLSSTQRVVLISPGQTLDGVYRLEHIGNDQITVTYLPLKQQQTVYLGTPP